MKLTGLVLTGGGARAAYQAGALKALAEIAKEQGVTCPFPIVTGSSAGAINAAYLASHAHDCIAAAENLPLMWSKIKTSDIYKVGMWSVGRLGMRWLVDLVTGNLYRDKMARALLDTSPLHALITREYNAENVARNLREGTLHSIAVSVVNYTTGNKEIFFQSEQAIKPWKRLDRFAVKTVLSPRHIIASSAIPLLFPPISINGSFYGDGSLRNYTPLSPAIKMGAEKVLVIALKQRSQQHQIGHDETRPTLARTASLILNSVLLDAVELDYERSLRINNTLASLQDYAPTGLKPIDILMLRPSKDIGEIAANLSNYIPKTVRHLVRGLGSPSEAADLISYLLFEPPYINTLIELGYHDTLNSKDKIIEFYKS